MAESPTLQAHQRLNPPDREGDSLPSRYGDSAHERDHVRATWGIVDFSKRGSLRLEGRDRQTFLQGMVSNDTRKLEPGRGIYATVLDPKGHMLGDLTLYAFPEFYQADTEPGMALALARTLDRYLIREKVKITVEDGLSARIGVSGPACADPLRRLFPTLPEIAGPFECASVEWEGAELRVMRRDFTGEEGYLLATAPDRGPALWKALLSAGAEPFGQEALEILRIEAGIPAYGRDMSVEVMPLEAGVFFGISRDKGCYIGQEIIERISSRGHTNRRLASLSLAPGPVPPPGSPIFHKEKEIGRITSAVRSPAMDAPVALGYLRHEAAAPGSSLRIVLPDGETTAEVLARPAFGSGEPPAITSADPIW